MTAAADTPIRRRHFRRRRRRKTPQLISYFSRYATP
jgi:hypothetical protein